MDEDTLLDVLTNIDFADVPDKAERFEAEAALLQPGEYGRASLLMAAGDHHQQRGEYDEALRCFEAAEADGGESAVDPIIAYLNLAMERGDQDAVARHRDTLRAHAKADRLRPQDFLDIGEIYEIHDQLREAHRWFTMPLTYADPDDEDLDYYCLIARLRVREAIGLPQDRFDVIAREELELQRAESD